MKINQDCNVFVTELSPNVASKALSIGKDRQAYLLCIEGSGKIAGQDMQRHDSAEIKGPFELELLSGTTGAYVLVFEMALTRDSRGRWCDNLNMCCAEFVWQRQLPGSILDTWWMNRLSFRLGPGNTMDKRDIIRCPFRCPFMQRLCIWNCTALLLGLDIDNPLHQQKYRHCKNVHALQHILKYTLYILREMANFEVDSISRSVASGPIRACLLGKLSRKKATSVNA